jgi:hypothetical protein
MVNVAPLATVTLEISRYGPVPADQIAFPLMEPPTLVNAPVSYQTTRFVFHTTWPLAPTASTSKLFRPGCNDTALFVQRPSHAEYVDAAPFTRTTRVSMALALPRNAIVGDVERGTPFDRDNV